MRLRTAAVAATTSALGIGAVAARRYAADATLRPARSGSLGHRGHRRLPAGFGGPALTVHDVGDGHVSLTRSLTAQLPGTYGLTGRDCHAVVGPVVHPVPDELPAPTADTVVRRLERIAYGELNPGTKVWLTPQVCTGGPGDAFGVERTEIEVPGELGALPAWFVPGHRRVWVITLHGLGAGPAQALPLLPFYARHHLPVLGLAYRGDPGVRGPAGGVRHLGGTEWRDVEAAIRYAVRHGAEKVVLHGWSSGASMALRAAAELRSRAGTEQRPGTEQRAGTEPGERGIAGRISGLVLDSPVLDWQAALRSLTAARNIPRPLVPLAVRAAWRRAHVEPDHPGVVVDPGALDVPALLLHGPDDTVASWETSREFAASREELISLHRIPHAPHAAMWNADPAAYEEKLRHFLTPLM
jgi:uncharacterized protein